MASFGDAFEIQNGETVVSVTLVVNRFAAKVWNVKWMCVLLAAGRV